MTSLAHSCESCHLERCPVYDGAFWDCECHEEDEGDFARRAPTRPEWGNRAEFHIENGTDDEMGDE